MIKKKICLLYLVLAFVLMVSVYSSCSKENEDEYYVRYEVCVVASGENVSNRVGMATPTGITYSTIVGSTNTWQATFGPVSRGFEASLTASDFRNATDHTFRISVSKNDGPYVVKVERNGNYTNTKFIIDD